ncbi:hypothetical protein ACJMK2_000393 [Sinanodonta woodiana]|uniref:G-protein coupled receptors family 1 profile domain-containing protein n=1 Tax=Sinanodonta woodiana TaxID=1069815 RepID=A0ABD3XP36_SINWO
MESTTLMYEDIDYINFWNISGNITNDMDMEKYEEILKFISLTRIIIPVLFGLITIFGLLGNILTIAGIQRHKTIRGITKYLIANLAITDILYIAFGVSFKAIYPVLHFWPFGYIWCRIHMYLEYVSYFAKIYTLVLMSLDRYIALVHPIRAIILRTKQNGYIALIASWILVILGNIPFIFIAKEEVTGEQTKVCYIHFEDPSRFATCYFMFSYLLPLIVLIFLNGHIFRVFLTGKTPTGYTNGDLIQLEVNKSVTKMVVLVVALYAVCWMPLQVIMLYSLVSKEVHFTVTFASIIYAAQCLAYMNSCINPILYTFYIHTFRNGIQNIICCRKTRRPTTGSHSSLITTSDML